MTIRKFVSFCFDDGFLASSRSTRRIFERRDLRATFCVMACPTQSLDSAHLNAVFADWSFWRSANVAGHDVAPHGWAHERLMDMPFESGRESVERALERFDQALPDFRPDRCVFHTPYLLLPRDLLDWLRDRCAGIRLAQGRAGWNRIECAQASGLIDCIAFGPEEVGAKARHAINAFVRSESEWLVLVLHGIDSEGWGPITSFELEGLLDLCIESGLAVKPVSEVIGIV